MLEGLPLDLLLLVCRHLGTRSICKLLGVSAQLYTRLGGQDVWRRLVKAKGFSPHVHDVELILMCPMRSGRKQRRWYNGLFNLAAPLPLWALVWGDCRRVPLKILKIRQMMLTQHPLARHLRRYLGQSPPYSCLRLGYGCLGHQNEEEVWLSVSEHEGGAITVDYRSSAVERLLAQGIGESIHKVASFSMAEDAFAHIEERQYFERIAEKVTRSLSWGVVIEPDPEYALGWMQDWISRLLGETQPDFFDALLTGLVKRVSSLQTCPNSHEICKRFDAFCPLLRRPWGGKPDYDSFFDEMQQCTPKNSWRIYCNNSNNTTNDNEFPHPVWSKLIHLSVPLNIIHHLSP